MIESSLETTKRKRWLALSNSDCHTRPLWVYLKVRLPLEDILRNVACSTAEQGRSKLLPAGLDGALDCKEYTWPEQPAGHFFKLDDLVLARWDKDNEFYPAIVTSRLRNGTYNVRFYDGVEAKQLGEADLKPRSTLSGEMDMPFSFLGSAQRSGNKRRIIRTEKKQMYDQQQVAKSGTRRQQKTSRKVSSARKGGKAAKVSKTSGGKKRKRQVKEEPAEVQPKKRRGGRQQNATKTQRRSTGRKGVKEESESETEEEDDTESVDEESSEEEEEVPKSGRRREKTPVRKPPVVTKRQTTVSAGMSLLARISSSLRGRSNPPKRQPSPKVAARGGSPRASPKRTKRDMLTKSVAAVLGQVLVSVAANIDLGMKECRVYLDSAIMYGKIDDTVNSSAVYADVLKKLKKLYDKWSIELITDQGAIHRGDVGVYLDIRVV